MNQKTYSAMLNSIKQQMRRLDGPARLFMLTVYSKVYVRENNKKQRRRYRQSLKKAKDKSWYRKIKWQPCACCKKEMHLELHHIIPINKGGDNDARNLISVCSDCHKKIHGVA